MKGKPIYLNGFLKGFLFCLVPVYGLFKGKAILRATEAAKAAEEKAIPAPLMQ